MHLFNGFLFSLMAVAISPVFSAPILANADSLEVRSIEDSRLDKRFTPYSPGATTLEQLPRQSRSIEKRGFPLPDIDSPPRFQIAVPVAKPPPSKPEEQTSQAERSKNVSKRGSTSDGGDGEKPKAAVGRVVNLGKKLARLFYHPIHRHGSLSWRAKPVENTGKADKGGDEDEDDGSAA